ncbi:Holliday junction branch migration protein RuvA [Candidatus Nomurabacteria bacterium]|nr:Holliday junction branch migration protein RuvA [Candidatus Nomurabacteria bacterium]
MIAFIQGTVQEKGKESILILTNSGVGYAIFMSVLDVAQIEKGSTVSLYTHLKVSENDMQLFGFTSFQQQAFFELLLSVKGVGPKAALRILSLGSLEEIQGAIARSDVKYLTAVQGMGGKTAERLVVELKSKVGVLAQSHDVDIDSEAMGEAFEALVSLGYNGNEVREVLKSLDFSQTSAHLIKQALKQLGR